MKRFFLFAGLALMLSGSALAGEADLFSYDQKALETEMADLTAIEDFVAAHPGISLSEMMAADQELVAGMTGSQAFYGLQSMTEKVLGIGGFWWGCCLGPVGVLVVWLGADDSAETRSSIIGCVVSTLLSGGSGLIYQIRLQ